MEKPSGSPRLSQGHDTPSAFICDALHESIFPVGNAHLIDGGMTL